MMHKIQIICYQKIKIELSSQLQKFRIMRLSSLKIAFVLIGLCWLFVPGQACRNDTRCVDCNPYYFLIGLSVFVYYNCDMCVINSGQNIQTKQCQCLAGFYPVGTNSCVKCPDTCATCTNETTCTSCYTEQKRSLSGASCACIENYESKNNEVICKQKPSILTIILSTIGSAVCMVLGFIVCAFIRMRRGSQQIHAQTKKRKNSNNAQIQIQCAEYEIQDNTSNMFWYSKSIPYKEEQICSICLDSHPLFMTDCGHYFHPKCIYDWLASKSSCPNCNKEIDQKNVRRWCEKCKKVLMPVIMNITIKRVSKRKKQIVHSSPVQLQLCDSCENETISQDALQSIEKNAMSADHNMSHDNQL